MEDMSMPVQKRIGDLDYIPSSDLTHNGKRTARFKKCYHDPAAGDPGWQKATVESATVTEIGEIEMPAGWCGVASLEPGPDLVMIEDPFTGDIRAELP